VSSPEIYWNAQTEGLADSQSNPALFNDYLRQIKSTDDKGTAPPSTSPAKSFEEPQPVPGKDKTPTVDPKFYPGDPETGEPGSWSEDPPDNVVSLGTLKVSAINPDGSFG
jgi:hypothetical protein